MMLLGLIASSIMLIADPNNSARSWAQLLLSGDASNQKQAVVSAAEERSQAIKSIAQILNFQTTRETRPQIAGAIKIAGILRASELSQTLVDLIDFQEFEIRPTLRPFSPKQDCIAVAALIQIGNPAIEPTLQRLAIENDPMNRLMCVTVIKEVEGDDLGKLVLAKAIEREKGERKANLQEGFKLWGWPRQ